MSDEIPPDLAGKTKGLTAALIARAEVIVGAELERELQPHLELIRQLTNVAGDLVEHVQNEPGEMRAVHVGAMLLSRLTTDLQACSLLVRRGYVAQALSLTSGMLELAHTSMYIGADEERAEQWMAHADQQTASPWKLKKTINAVAAAMGVPTEAALREYNEIYRQMSMAKHGNPMLFGEVGIVERDNWTFIVAGPYSSGSVSHLARAALLYGVRYTKLAAMKFARDHVPGSPERDGTFHTLARLSEEETRLTRAAAADDSYIL
jgi:hypothetical protein